MISMKNLSMRQFAKLANVSPATVSRVFSGATNVADEKRTRILQLAEQTGFRPNPIARAAFGEKTRSVGVLLGELSSSYFGQIACGIQEVLLQEDYLPIIMGIHTEARTAMRRMMDHRVDGLIVGFSEEDVDLKGIVNERIPGMPIVSLDQARFDAGCDSVINDDIAGGRQVAEYLLGLGHHRFGFCYFGAGHSNSDRRLLGFREGLAKAGVAMPDENIAKHLPFNSSRDEIIIKSLQEMLSRPDRPTAIFASADTLALFAYKAAKKLGLKIPEDLSVVGFADLQYSEYLAPPLTTMSQAPWEMGRQAASLMLRRLSGDESATETVVLPVKLTERESCAKPGI